MIFTKYGGRRFLMCMGCAIVCTGLVMFGIIGDTIFRDIILGTVAVYVAGGTAQKFKSIEAANESEIDARHIDSDKKDGDRY